MRRLAFFVAAQLWVANMTWGQDYNPEDFLPLAVGNSWTYSHSYFNDLDLIKPEIDPIPDSLRVALTEVTITITHTEEIDGHTYYVFSDLGYDFPRAPYFFLAGKKVRFAEDGRPMERSQDTELSLYNFSPDIEGLYAIPEHNGDTMVRRSIEIFAVPFISFIFLGHEQAYDQRDANFIQFFGMRRSPVAFILSDVPSLKNDLRALYAIIDRKRIEEQDRFAPRLCHLTPGVI